MKSFLFALVFALASQSFADCYQQVDAQKEQEMAEKEWKYFGLELFTESAIKEFMADPWEMGANELSDDQIELIKSYIGKDVEFYSYTGTGDYSGGFQSLVIVEQGTCQELHDILYYAE